MPPYPSQSIERQVKVLENTPGVYQFYEKNGNLLYVGKAKKIKNRIQSYFLKINQESGKTRLMVSKIDNIKIIYLDSENDALLLENSLIKKHQPRYNIQWKDDKTYPWICIKKEMFPRISYTRKKARDGSAYFGPYPSVNIVKTIIEMVKKSFEIRSCDHKLTKEKINNEKYNTAVDFYIGNCKGCCQGKVNKEEYNQRLNLVKNVLNGQTGAVLKTMRKEMLDFASGYQYEKAEELKIKIQNIEKFQAKSSVVDNNITSLGVMNISHGESCSFVNSLKVVNGAITRSKTVLVKRTLDESDSEILSLIATDNLIGFFSDINELVLPLEFELYKELIIRVPKRGDKKKLLMLSYKNAYSKCVEYHKSEQIKTPNYSNLRILEKIKNDLNLAQLPVHMECFDNSNNQGDYPVAACVVFKNAKPSKKEYRHFNIKSVEGANDFASMEEVLYRRYSRLIKERKNLPQLIVVDGGKGQLSSAIKSLKLLNLDKKIAIIGIAKKLEEIYYPGDQLPLYLDKKSITLKTIQLMRNEAHRFGINHHRSKRIKGTVKTELLKINGIGDKTITTLLKKFKSVKKIKTLSIQEIEALIGKSKGKKLYKGLH